MTEQIKKTMLKWLTLPNIVIILSALFIVYRLYISLPRIEEHEQRLDILEKDIIKMHHQINTNTLLLTEVRTDIKMIINKKEIFNK